MRKRRAKTMASYTGVKVIRAERNERKNTQTHTYNTHIQGIMYAIKPNPCLGHLTFVVRFTLLSFVLGISKIKGSLVPTGRLQYWVQSNRG